MKLRKAKKGFTLVELVVVIAIIAILSTVSVVGYLGFTKKANVSGDKALVSQLNTILKADQATNGKAETPTEAIEAVKESGYLVEKLAAKTSKYKIVWNQKDNEFALLDEEEKAVAGKVSSNAYENWVFADNYNAEKGYSVYLNSGYSGNSTLDITTGLDVGENTNVEVVNYTNTESAKHVVIRTNGGELTVNAPLDTVEHYEKADKVVITSIANESFHEYGEVTGNIEIESGHLAVESTANVSTIVAKPTNTVKLSVTNEENVGTIVTTDTTKTTLNVPESVKPSESLSEDKLAEMEKFDGGLGTEKSPYLISSREDFINIKYISSKGYNFKLTNNIDLTNLEKQVEANSGDEECLAAVFSGTIDGNNKILMLGNSEKDGNRIFLFDDSNGTAIFKNINLELIDNMVGLFGYYGYASGSTASDYLKFENINVYNASSVKFTSRNTAYESAFICQPNSYKKVIWENCNNYANMTSTTYNGIFLANYSGSAYLSFINCHNYAYVTGRNVGFFNGNANAQMLNPNLVENESFEDAKSGVANFYIKNCSNEGQMIGTQAASPFMTWSGDTDKTNEINSEFNSKIISKGLFVNNGIIAVSNKKVELLYENNKLSISKSSDYEAGYTYRVIYSRSISYNGGGSSYLLLSFDLEREDSIDLISRFVSSSKYENENNIKYSDITAQEQISNGVKYKLIRNKDNTYTAIFEKESLNNAYGCDNSTYDVKPIIYVYALNNNGSVVGSKLYSLNDFIK